MMGSFPGAERAFALLNLPAELRNRIYEYAVISSDRLLVPSTCKHDDRPTAQQPALTKVNRQVREETIKTFYAENVFVYHIHRCDFEYMFEWMTAIGLENRSSVRKLQLVIKDRWTCGVGLLDFLRWCTNTKGIENLWLMPDPHEWQKEQFLQMDENDQQHVLERENNIGYCMAASVILLIEMVDLSNDLTEQGRRSEHSIRPAFLERLIALEMTCRCIRKSCNGSRDGKTCACAFEGYCTRMWKHVGIENRTALAKGCMLRH
ncbi:Hypothetical predicted protein [Lecanosticta acicola]|uniref:Uncharacterized protein n=1 Tax=Lecanosticta acicola TaxID=111012 RepID=A0AAI8Z6B0_9PEZI|nr:Hypothetical predicted protein [Lecanosticta acicola]